MNKPAKPPRTGALPKPVPQQKPNPRLQADLRWQRSQRFTWDKNRGRA